jgi:glycosyltransferase involved in cell wall biosynthesis
MSRPSLSVVMPVYNEQEALPAVLDDLRTCILDRLEDCEAVLVNDGSTDATAALLDASAEEDPRLQIIHAPENRGHGPSVYAGLQAARGEWMLQLDSDGQVELEEFWLLWDRREQGDLVMGYRRPRRDGWHRRAVSFVLRWLVRALARGRTVRDVNVPFKLIRRGLWDHLEPAMPRAPVVPSALIVLGALRGRARVIELRITHRPRAGGRTVLIPTRLLAVSMRAARELLGFRGAAPAGAPQAESHPVPAERAGGVRR